jgi:hypothetical protein
MITLTTISTIYSIFGLIIFKKKYGTYEIFHNDPKLWTIMLALTLFITIVGGITLMITYLP